MTTIDDLREDEKLTTRLDQSAEVSEAIAASNVLGDFAARIREEHAAATAALNNGLRHAIAAGQLLIAAKKQVPHGQWLPWLRDHCGVAERTAQAYARVARGYDGNPQRAAGLTFRQAVDLLAKANVATARPTTAGLIASASIDHPSPCPFGRRPPDNAEASLLRRERLKLLSQAAAIERQIEPLLRRARLLRAQAKELGQQRWALLTALMQQTSSVAA
jgi:hypothetical protein